MSSLNSLQELQELIHEKFGIDAATLDPHASMRGTAAIDSLALVEFLFAIEDKYGISLPEQYSNLDTLAELAEVVDKLRAEQAQKQAA
jgi:acyl carrier protein